jgi:peptidoglycan/xylan/chitin deacetylase (PgdA/CDA1 family)
MSAVLGRLDRLARKRLRGRYPFVLCYHGVGPTPTQGDPHGLFVSSKLFEQHLELIQGSGYRLLTVSGIWQLMKSDPSAIRVGSITFDDGLRTTVREAIPILQRRGIPCSMFVPTGMLGAQHPDLEGETIIGPSEILELDAAGVEIGAHSVDHTLLTGLQFNDAFDQVHRSRAMLEDLLGKPVRTMAYPYGAFNEQTIRAVREASYEIACGCSGPARWQALSLPREPVHPTTTPLRLRLKMAGLYGPVHALHGDRGPGRWMHRS